MRILLNAAFVSEAPVGISRYIKCLVPHLARLCELTVLTSDPGQFQSMGCRTREIPRRTESQKWRLVWTLTCLGFLASKEYDILLCPTPEVPPVSRIPVIALLHDLIPLALPAMHSSRYKAFFWLTLQTLRWADVIITETANTKKDLTRLKVVRASRVRVVPAGPGMTPSPAQERPAGQEPAVPTHAATTGSAAARGERFILYVGGHSLHKNVPRLVTAFSRLQIPADIKLYLVGWGKDEHIVKTRRAVQACGAEGRVVLLDWLPDRELSLLYRNCLLFVFPSLYEGFGLPVLEALAHGAPVACSRTSSIPEIGGDAALYFNPLSVNDIAEKLQLLYDNAELARRLRESGPRQARRYSWEETAKRVYDIAVALDAKSTCTPMPGENK